jgi:Recombination endonuclease VII
MSMTVPLHSICGMPRRDPEARREFDRQRNADPERRARVNARRRQRYAESPEVRAKQAAYSQAYRDEHGDRLREQDRARNRDPARKARLNARRRERYASDPEFREHYRAYQQAYLTAGPVHRNTQRSRAVLMGWTAEQEAEFLKATACEICGGPPGKRGLFADHCHDCGRYRGPLCHTCNIDEGILRKWQAVCPPGSPMRIYLDRHQCEGAAA